MREFARELDCLNSNKRASKCEKLFCPGKYRTEISQLINKFRKLFWLRRFEMIPNNRSRPCLPQSNMFIHSLHSSHPMLLPSNFCLLFIRQYVICQVFVAPHLARLSSSPCSVSWHRICCRVWCGKIIEKKGKKINFVSQKNVGHVVCVFLITIIDKEDSTVESDESNRTREWKFALKIKLSLPFNWHLLPFLSRNNFMFAKLFYWWLIRDWGRWQGPMRAIKFFDGKVENVGNEEIDQIEWNERTGKQIC